MEDWYARYKNVRDSVWKLLLKNNIRTLPVDVVALAESLDIINCAVNPLSLVMGI